MECSNFTSAKKDGHNHDLFLDCDLEDDNSGDEFQEIVLVAGISMRRDLFIEAHKENVESQFVNCMAKGLWRPHDLAERCVQQRKGVLKQQLTPNKYKCILKEFKIWLRSRNIK